jgi:hypothetical protein
MPLFLDLEPGDAVRIGEKTVLRVERKSGGRTRVRFDTDYRVTLERGAAAKDPQRPAAAPPAPADLKRPF